MKPLILILMACLILGLVGLTQHAQSAGAPLDSGVAIAQTEGGTGGHANLGESLPLWSGLPFVGILLSIALFPLFAPHFWHHHYPKVSAFWGAAMAVPFLFAYGGSAVTEILHIYIIDYLPFIILLWSLYTISGGILLRGTLVGTPGMNAALLLISTLLASWMGTTGAAMLMIRPFLRANKHRKNRTFMVVFFIFLVANIGGALTPLGDPPLFLGFLHGVPFFWTMFILPHMLLTIAIVLSVYFAIDWIMYRKENIQPYTEEKQPLRLCGAYNFLFLAGVVVAVLMSGLLHLGSVSILGVPRALQDIARDVLLIVFGVLSLTFTPKSLREENEFTWSAIKEVAYLFAGIFMTMIPCLAILKAGEHGAAAFLVGAVNQPWHYFWITGALSSFLDNAPTYLTFFTSALGKFYPGMPEGEAVAQLIQTHPQYLAAISAGAVFFGACTYIGNAPNFMVRSIAEESGTPMPSFFGYMFLYSMTILIPVFLIVTWIFFHS
jgi:Na+/H+ antiporter NhaD/arsenite permease-like protein